MIGRGRARGEPPPAGRPEALLHPVMEHGRPTAEPPALEELRRRFAKEMGRLPREYRVMRSPAHYRVEHSPALTELAAGAETHRRRNTCEES